MGFPFVCSRGVRLDYLRFTNALMVAGFYLLCVLESRHKKLGQMGEILGKLSI